MNFSKPLSQKARAARAVAFSQTARPAPDGPETIYEVFRILDNFNVPLEAVKNNKGKNQESRKGMRNATQWTDACDTKNLVLYCHTQNNRRVRRVDMKRIDFDANPDVFRHYPLDKVEEQDIQDVTP